jgi:hypothetical protein
MMLEVTFLYDGASTPPSLFVFVFNDPQKGIDPKTTIHPSSFPHPPLTTNRHPKTLKKYTPARQIGHLPSHFI